MRPARALAVILLPLTLLACEKSVPPREPSTPTPVPPSVRTYHARGRILTLPDPARKSHLVIHHERLPEFYSADGRNVGMNEMEMDFPWLSPSVSLVGLAPGDAVAFDFDVDWNNSERLYTVTKIAKLPPGDTLQLHAKEAK